MSKTDQINVLPECTEFWGIQAFPETGMLSLQWKSEDEPRLYELHMGQQEAMKLFSYLYHWASEVSGGPIPPPPGSKRR
jgi:hypothetical protein